MKITVVGVKLGELGHVVWTPALMEVATPEDVLAALERHTNGDWGELDDEDKRANDAAVDDGERVLSVYTTASGHTFWIITEADRSATTLLLPSDY